MEFINFFQTKMNFYMRTKVFLSSFMCLLTHSIFVDCNVWRSPNSDDKSYWREYGENHLKKILKSQKIKSVDSARNAIIFGKVWNWKIMKQKLKFNLQWIWNSWWRHVICYDRRWKNTERTEQPKSWRRNWTNFWIIFKLWLVKNVQCRQTSSWFCGNSYSAFHWCEDTNWSDLLKPSKCWKPRTWSYENNHGLGAESKQANGNRNKHEVNQNKRKVWNFFKRSFKLLHS